MSKNNKFSPEVRERAVRLVQEHRGEYPSQWAAVQSIAPKIGCSGYTLLKWVQLQEVEAGTRPGVPQAEQERIKALEREVKELRRANEILKSASAFFAQAALDRELKNKRLHRPASGPVWGRADLQGVAGRPVSLPAICCPMPQSGTAKPTSQEG